MNVKKWIALCAVLVLVLTMFAGCAADSAKSEYGAAGDYEYGDGMSGLTNPGESAESPLPTEQKLIRTIRMTAETEDMDALLPQIEQRVNELGGYVESQEIYNGSVGTSRSRYANYVIRIPAQQLDQFVNQVSDVSNIVSKNESTEDVTLSYIEVEGRIKALETEQTRLLELLAMAESMEDLLQIESRLTDVRAELEQVTSTLRMYDNKVNYGTIHLNVDEVVEYTEEKPEGFWDRITTGFAESMENTGTIITELTIFIIVAIPYLIPGAVFIAVAVVIAVIVNKVARKKRQKKQEQK